LIPMNRENRSGFDLKTSARPDENEAGHLVDVLDHPDGKDGVRRS
jgi:hypothetical protein